MGTNSEVHALSVKKESSQLRFVTLAKHQRRSSGTVKEVILLAEIPWILYQGGTVCLRLHLWVLVAQRELIYIPSEAQHGIPRS